MVDLPIWPDWWSWEIVFSGHAELRMEQRGITEVDIRKMLQEATRYSSSAAEGRFMIKTKHRNRPWLVVVEPDEMDRKLLIITTFEGEL